MLISPSCRLGKSLSEIRQEIKDAENLRLKKWSEEREQKLQGEETEVASAKQTPPGDLGIRPATTQKKTGRKDNSPVKVRTVSQ